MNSEERENVIIVLVDFIPKNDDYHHNFQHHLKIKMENQSVGFLNWFQKREQLITQQKRHLYNFTPIEYMQDKEVILKSEFISERDELLPDSWRDDKDLMLKYISYNDNRFKEVSERLKSDKEFVIQAIKLSVKRFGFANKERVNAMLRSQESIYYLIPESLKSDEQILWEAVKATSWEYILKYAPEHLTRDRSFLLEAITHEAAPIGGSSFKNDRSFILEAVKRNVFVMDYLPDKLREDRNFNLEIVKSNGKTLRLTDFTEDRDVAMEAVKQFGSQLKHASYELKQDKQICMTAVNNNHQALKHASVDIRDDQEVVLAAVSQEQSLGVLRLLCDKQMAFSYASERLRHDRDTVLKVVKMNYENLKYVSKDLLMDEEFMTEVLKIEIKAIEYARENIKSQKSFFLETINKKEPKLIRFASDSIRNDPQVIMEAILTSNNLSLLNYASKQLKTDKNFLLQVISQLTSVAIGNILAELPVSLRNDPSFLESIIEQTPCLCKSRNGATLEEFILQSGPRFFRFFPNVIQNTEEYLLRLIKSDVMVMSFISKVWKNRSFMLKAIQVNGHALAFASDDLLRDKELIEEAVKQNGYVSLTVALDRFNELLSMRMKTYPNCFIPKHCMTLKFEKVVIQKPIVVLLASDCEDKEEEPKEKQEPKGFLSRCLTSMKDLLRKRK